MPGASGPIGRSITHHCAECRCHTKVIVRSNNAGREKLLRRAASKKVKLADVQVAALTESLRILRFPPRILYLYTQARPQSSTDSHKAGKHWRDDVSLPLKGSTGLTLHPSSVTLSLHPRRAQPNRSSQIHTGRSGLSGRHQISSIH